LFVLLVACAERTAAVEQETCGAGASNICMGNDVYACKDGETTYSHTCPSDLVCNQGACYPPGQVPDASTTSMPDASNPMTCSGSGSCSSTSCSGEWCSNKTGVCAEGACRACRTGDRTCDDGSLWLLLPGRTECADTTTAGNDFHSGLCPGTGGNNPITVGGETPDNLWIFNPTVDGTYTVTVRPDGPWDTIVYISEGFCLPPTTASCRGYSNKMGAGGAETLTFPALSTLSYVIAVDGLDNPAGNWLKTGRYRISLTGP
jgi:hypothetical protein